MATAVPTGTGRAHAEEPRFVLSGVGWNTYLALREDLDRAHRKTRLTYDRGSLELMTLSTEHEVYSHGLASIVEILCEELDLSYSDAGSTTFHREDVQKGFEPDQSYYFQSAPLIRGKKRIELPADPPPDLTIEVDITSSTLSRMGIFAALGVPEVWRYDGETMTVYRLGEGQQYAPVAASSIFPVLPMSELARFLELRPTMEKLPWVKMVRAWVRETVLPLARAEGGAGA